MSSVRQRRGGGLPPDEGGPLPGTVTSDEADDAATASLPVRVARQCWGHLVVLYVVPGWFFALGYIVDGLRVLRCLFRASASLGAGLVPMHSGADTVCIASCSGRCWCVRSPVCPAFLSGRGGVLPLFALACFLPTVL